MGGIYEDAVQIGSSAVIHLPNFIKTGSGIVKLTRGDSQRGIMETA
jgi:hypothetical protein